MEPVKFLVCHVHFVHKMHYIPNVHFGKTGRIMVEVTLGAAADEMNDGKQTKVRFNFTVEPEVLEALDELRKREPSPMPNRTEMLKRLIRRSLAVPAPKPPVKS